MGDLNSSVSASATGDNNDILLRGNGNIKLFALTSETTESKVRVDFTPDMAVNTDGMQMELNFDPTLVKYTGIDQGILTGLSNSTCINTSNVANGSIKISWVSNNAIYVDPTQIMFSMLFEKLNNAGNIKFKLNPYGLNPELYDRDNNTFDIELINEKVASVNGFALFQNRPNPLQSYTSIGFNLPEASDIELNIYDVTGNVVKTIKGTYAKGTNKVDIEWTNTKGVYYYMLKAGDNVATKKMIVIE